MKIIIGIDIGNTNTKINFSNQHFLTIPNQEINKSNWVDMTIEDMDLKNYMTSAQNLGQAKVILSISSVISTTNTQNIINNITAFWNLNSSCLKIWSASEILHLSKIHSLSELSTFGADRALKVYYLNQSLAHKTKISIGCGTAFTVELIKDGSLHESFILPGLTMQLNSLAANTAQLPTIQPQEIKELLQIKHKFSTPCSIINGVLNSYLGIIDRLTAGYQPKAIICSGGYAQLIKDHYSKPNFPLILIPYLESKVLIDLAQHLV